MKFAEDHMDTIIAFISLIERINNELYQQITKKCLSTQHREKMSHVAGQQQRKMKVNTLKWPSKSLDFLNKNKFVEGHEASSSC